jgi:hypothetical protein
MPDFNRYKTANVLVQDVCKIMGLPAPVSAAASLDSTSRQLWTLLSQVGQEVMDEYDWQIIDKTYNFMVQDPVLSYALPADLQKFIDSTGWNITSRIPLIGPLTSQQWALLQARQLGGTTLRMQYIIQEGFFRVYWAPSDAQEISISYQSRGWVQDGTTPTTFRDYVENDSDVVMFEPRLVITKLILEWRKKKGFSTVDDQAAYDKALSNAKYNDRPKVDLQTSGTASYPYLGYLNMPDQGYGNP